ncbi:MFS transporter [Yoonia sp. BS5-3]|uniref:MFS transporter n=1 Tax=Yoonia phaeophyticola TaxID=3137369 RepID=A0ABZ2V4P1_9RHOB
MNKANSPFSPALRQLLVAQVPADFADWLDFVAIGALLAFVWQLESFVFAVLAISLGLPYLLIGPVAGVLVDRADINRILIFSNLGRGLMTAALFWAPDWGAVMICVALRSLCDTFYSPAKQAALQSLTTPSQRMRANGLSHAINQASKIVAPALGGGLLIWLAPQSVFLINAAASGVAVLMVMWLSPIPRPPQASTAGIGADIWAGLQEVRQNRILRAALLMMGAGYFAMFFYDTLIAPLTRDLGFSQTFLGLALAAVGGGGVLGAALLGARNFGIRPFALISLGAGISGAMVLALGMVEVNSTPINAFIFVLFFAVLGFASTTVVVPFRTILQDTVTPARIGRVIALSEALNTGALLIAPFIGAWIASVYSVGAAFICGGIVMICVAIGAWALRACA